MLEKIRAKGEEREGVREKVMQSEIIHLNDDRNKEKRV